MLYLRVLRSAAALLALALPNAAATAQGADDWPNRSVRIIVNFGPADGLILGGDRPTVPSPQALQHRERKKVRGAWAIAPA